MHADPMRRDVIAQGAGSAHADACPSTADAAVRWGHTPRNQRHWREGGPPALRAFFDYIRRCDDPWHVLGQVTAWCKWRSIERLTDAVLIERYRELVAEDKRQEAEDTICDLNPLATWEQVERSHRVDAAYDLELAACAAECRRRGLSRGTVLHG